MYIRSFHHNFHQIKLLQSFSHCRPIVSYVPLSTCWKQYFRPTTTVNCSYCTNNSSHSQTTLAHQDHNILLHRLKHTSHPVKEEEKNDSKENIYTIPNGLCVFRLLTAPVIAYTVASQMYIQSLALFTIAGFTDLVDGLIARKFKDQKSKLGSILDPLADKILVTTLFISLSLMDQIPAWLTVIVISRDVILIMASAFLRYKSLTSPRTFSNFFNPQSATLEIRPSLISKINTTLQLVLVGSTLAAPLLGIQEHQLMNYFHYVVATSTLCSGVCYALSKNSYRFLSHTKS